jgi:PKD domain
MRHVCSAIAVAVSLIISSVCLPQAHAQDTSNLSLTNYKVVSQQPITSTLSNFTYSVTLVNAGPRSFGSVTGTVSSNSFNVRTVPGQDQVTFTPVPPNSQVPGGNTFSVLVDQTLPLDIASSVQWTFQTTAPPPVANPGPNQTAKLGNTVVLNGGASTNPSGAGTLTYSWRFTSRPAGSIATLNFDTIVNPSFVVDVDGTYVIQLTVSNGVASSSANVLVSTTNSPPVAVAGPNQTAAVGSKVVLNGSGSSDIDGDPLTFHWALILVPSGSTAALTGANTVSPTFVVDTAGKYMAQLVVNDGLFNSNPSSVTITTQNTAPVANAGSNQVVVSGSLVHLNGSASTDVDGDPLTYQWTLITLPTGSTAALSNPTVVSPTFTADLTGTYVAQLVVNDGKVNSTAATVTITTNAVQAPTANAGPNQTVGHGTTVGLSGGGTDPQGLPLTFKWALTTKPAGSTAVLSSTTVVSPTFVADLPGSYVAQLIVNNGFLSSAPSTVTITTTNTPPVSNAGADQNVRVGITVTLDGSGSSDADHDPLTYSWSLLSRPDGSAATLSAATSSSPTFVADVIGTYVAQLIVNDGLANSAPTTVMITAAANTAIALTPSPLSIGLNSTVTLTLTLPNPAGPSGQLVSLASFDPSIASVPSTVNVPPNATSTNVSVTGGNTAGTTTIAASAPGISSGAVTVNVSALSIAITLDSSTVGLGKTMNGTVTLSAPAPAGGAVVAFSSNPSGIVDVQPPSVIIPAGSVSGTLPASATGISASTHIASAGAFTVTGLALGSTTLVASSAGFFSGSVTVNVGLLGAITLPSGITVGPNQSAPFPVSLVTGAPLGGVTVNLSSSDPSKVTVSPASVFIPQGATTPATQPQVTGVSFGSAVISASASGFTGDSKTVQVNAGLGFASSTLTLAKGATQNLTLNLSAPAPASGLTVNTSSSDTTVATVPATVVFAPNSMTAPLPVTAVGSGNAVIHASALPNFPDVTASVTVVLFGAIHLPPSVSAPAGQSVPLALSLPVGAPAGGVTVTLVSSDPSRATTTPTVFIAPGTTTPATPAQVTGVNIGSVLITASSPGFTTASTNATITPGAASIAAVSGGGQSTRTNTAFAAPFVAVVRDASSNPVNGGTVTFFAPNSGPSGTFAGGTSVVTVLTDASGLATSPTFTANGTAGGPYSVSALVASFGASFTATNTVGPPASITATDGGGQSAQINASFAAPLVAIVKDSGGNPVSGTSVTFTAAATGPSGTFAGGGNTFTISTNSSGIATSATFTANGAAGPYSVSASVPGVAATASYSLTNTSGAPASIAATSGGSQSAQVNTAFAAPLVVTVKDAGGNPVSGATVTFTGPASGAGVATVTAVTNASGVAPASVTANGTSGGPYNVSATVAGVATPANFSLTNTAGAPGAITATSGGSQSAQINTAFAAPLVATVKDGGGNPVSGVTVTFTGPASGTSVATVTAVTNASGAATASVTANGTAGGPYNVSATVAGVATPANYSLTNTAGSPASVTATSGGGQSAQINAVFAAPLVATVKDGGGNPVSGVTVTFTGPASGASVATVTAVTNTSGVATGSVTANGTAGGPYNVSATVPGVATPANYSLTNSPGVPGTVIATSGGGQSAQTNTAFAAPLVATVKDGGGNPVGGVTVTFSGPASGPSVATVTAVTNASGVATASVTANNTAGGPYNVSATVAGVATPATFSVTNTPAPPTSITATSGGGQSAQINTAFAAPLVATVKDGGGNPVSGVTVTFTGPASGASVATVTAVTNASGVATAGVTANGTSGGPYTVSATVPGVGTPANYSLTNSPGAPGTITATSGGGQSAQINTSFAASLIATVKDGGGNPIGGVTVTFSGPASGASVATATAATNASGVATASVTANGTAGGPYTVSATVAGVATPATYSLTNTPGPPASITATSGGGQSTQISTAFAAPLVATVKDGGGNPVNGVTVTFTGPASGSSMATVTAVTNASGVASRAVTANGTAGGPYNVSATVSGVATPANYSLTNTSGAPASVTATGGTGQAAVVSTVFAAPLSVIVKDAGGNPVSGAAVIFSGPASGASIVTTTLLTNGSGIVTATATANGTAGGPYTVTATVAGATSATFSLTNTPVASSGGIAVTSASVGQNLEANITVTLPQPAPPGGVMVTLKSSDGNK